MSKSKDWDAFEDNIKDIVRGIIYFFFIAFGLFFWFGLPMFWTGVPLWLKIGIPWFVLIVLGLIAGIAFIGKSIWKWAFDE